MMKVVHLLQSSFFSGAENVACQIINMFSNSNNIKMVYVSKKGSIESIIKSRGINFYGLESFNLKSVKEMIIKIRPDAIHAHDIFASVMAAICAPAKCKIISHVHVNNRNMSHISIKSILYLIASIRFSRIFWVSQSSYDSFIFKKLVSSKSFVLSNVIDKEKIIQRLEEDSNKYNYDVAYVGRITYQKNPEKLASVLFNLCNIDKRIKIAIVGTGDKYGDFVNLINEKKIGDYIDFYGFMENPLRIISSSKVMIMTSRYEGLPMTVLEAMALGTPIVSTPVDGLKDFIYQGENGYLVEDNDIIAKKVFQIIHNDGLRKMMSKRSVEIFDEKMDLNTYKNHIESAYNI